MQGDLPFIFPWSPAGRRYFFQFIIDTALLTMNRQLNASHFTLFRTLFQLYQTSDQRVVTVNRKILASWRNCDERFFWNLNVVSDLIDTPGLDDRWITPVSTNSF